MMKYIIISIFLSQSMVNTADKLINEERTPLLGNIPERDKVDCYSAFWGRLSEFCSYCYRINCSEAMWADYSSSDSDSD